MYEPKQVEVECNGCGSVVTTDERNKNAFVHDGAECDECRRVASIDRLHKDLDPNAHTYDSNGSRAKAIMYLKQEFGFQTIVDYDGSIIADVTVEHGRGIGAEPNGYYVEDMEKIIECPECGYDGARSWYKSNSQQHVQQTMSCPRCKHSKENV